MAKLVVLYKSPQDKEHFDAYYHSTHIPLAKAIPGLQRYEISSGPVGSRARESGIHLVAILSFDSMEALGAALGSPEGAAAAGDLDNFASGGADLLMFETKEA